MALIKCPECKKKISDQCESCPNCGYPVKASFATNDISTSSTIIASEADGTADGAISKTKKSILKRVWFWIAIAVIIAVAVVAVIILLNGEVKPKVDENGNPIFVELTDEVYTNADEYLGYYVAVKGKVFQNLGDNGDTKGIQVWIDPDSCEQNMMLHYTTEGSFKDGDYVICTGYIKEIHTYTNAYGTKLSVPLIYSTDLRGASYIEVMSPTVSTITPESLTYEEYGYSVTVDKIEFAENETRLYLTTTNNGNATLYVDASSSVIVQNDRQHAAKANCDANYEELPFCLNRGATASGIVVFPVIDDADFEYVLELHSDNYEERFDKVTFRIGTEASSIYIPIFEPNVVWELGDFWLETDECIFFVDYVKFYDNVTSIRLSVFNERKSSINIDVAGAIIVQNQKQFATRSVIEAPWNDLEGSIDADGFTMGEILFYAIEPSKFEFTIKVQFDDEESADMVFVLDEDSAHLKNKQ